MSHLLQMRGLKPGVAGLAINEALSHLLQMRGLKHFSCKYYSFVLCRIFYRCVD